MRKQDTEYLLTKIAAVDNRIVTDETVETWHEIIGHLSAEVADRSLLKARQDQAINWIEPRHIVAKARDAIIDLNDEARKLARDAEDEGRADPEPICRAHRRRITTCADCCRVLATDAGHLKGDRLHEWAVANLYVEQPF
jgi:hypothetical protein